MLPVNYLRWQCSFQSYLEPVKRYAFRQLLELTAVAFTATKTLSTVGVDIPDCSFPSYQNPVNAES